MDCEWLTYSLVSKVMMMRMGLLFMPPTQLLLHMKLYRIVVNSVPTWNTKQWIPQMNGTEGFKFFCWFNCCFSLGHLTWNFRMFKPFLSICTSFSKTSPFIVNVTNPPPESSGGNLMCQETSVLSSWWFLTIVLVWTCPASLFIDVPPMKYLTEIFIVLSIVCFDIWAECTTY